MHIPKQRLLPELLSDFPRWSRLTLDRRRHLLLGQAAETTAFSKTVHFIIIFTGENY